MRALLIAHSRWAAEGLAAALRRASGGEATLELLPFGLADWRQAEGQSRPPMAAMAEVAVLAGLPGADAQELLRRLPAGLPVLLLLAAEDTQAEWSAELPHRPLGRLPEGATDAQLHAALLALAAGLSVHLPGAAPATARPGTPEILREPLTARELEVFELMAKGLGNRDIAGVLGISAHTAKFHVAQILDKTGSATRTEAVHHGLRLGLVGL